MLTPRRQTGIICLNCEPEFEDEDVRKEMERGQEAVEEEDALEPGRTQYTALQQPRSIGGHNYGGVGGSGSVFTLRFRAW